jgi:uncharacterized protein (TIGR02145 family)
VKQSQFSSIVARFGAWVVCVYRLEACLEPRTGKCNDLRLFFGYFHQTKSACYAGRGKLQKFKLMESVMTTKQPIKIFSRLSFWSVAIGSMAILAACGDDVTKENITQVLQDRTQVVTSVADLPDCTQENQGEQVLVKNEASPRICVDGTWFATFEKVMDDFTCSAEALHDGSGYKILCNGDSIGTVLNGTNGVPGAQGIQGIQGIQGEKGDKGDTGEQGIQGEKGDKGDTGEQGIQGEKGDKGDTGEQGIQGEKGDKGDTGEQGIQGEKGDKGDTGEQGIQGEKGEKGDTGEGCSIDRVENTITVICGDKVATIRIGDIVGDDEDIIHFEDIVLDSQKIAVILDSLKGFTQKGPFVKGATVTLQELEDGRTLKLGTANFSTSTVNDSGHYKIAAISLASQYALLQVKGYYNNEITGGKSDAELTLNAMVNMLKQKTANINLLTHLEYNRARSLVTLEEKTADYAKKRAWSEILAMFYIDAEGKKYFEDMNLLDADENAAILLGISVLLQGDNTTSELAALLARISSDIESDGTWDEESTKARLADWAESFDRSGTIRANLESLGISTAIDFEKYLTNFWIHEYGLGPCVAVRYKEIAQDTSPSSSNFGEHYYCDANGWRKATDIEKDTYGWSAGTNGEVRQGEINSDLFYIYGNGAWQPYSSALETVLGVCTEARESEVRKSGNTYYICRSKIWNIATPYEYNTYGWRAGTEGEVREGEGKTGEYYIFTDGNWVEYPIGHDLGICTTSREKEIGPSGGIYYICRSKSWVEATLLEYDTYGYACNDNGSILDGKVIPANKYVCDRGAFRATNEQELLRGEGCTGYTLWKTVRKAYTATQDSLYTCTETGWVDSLDIHYDIMTDLRDYKTYKIVKIGSQTWMAENLNYSDSVAYPDMKKRNWCYNDSMSNCNKHGRLYTWSAAMDSAGTWSTNGKGCGYYGKTCSPTYPVRGICPEGWHLPTEEEFETLISNVGGIETAGKMLKSTTGWYEDGNGIDAFGFNIFPAGYRGSDGSFYSAGRNANFWSATSGGYDAGASSLWVRYSSEGVELYTNIRKTAAYSVRCLRDSP